tara:strand:+ start:118 stop:762 length:645 start_codon:yes stop_codon:yes gene_type:complete
MRKQPNKLFYGKHTHKLLLTIPGAYALQPTTEHNLIQVSQQSPDEKVRELAKLLFKHKKQIQFRISSITGLFQPMSGRKQNGNVSIYCDRDAAKYIAKTFWNELYDIQAVENANQMSKNTVACKRLPHGKYEYQVHVSGYLHKKINPQERDALANMLLTKDSVRIASQTLKDYLEHKKDYCWGGYFYIENESMLSAVYMISQKSIDKVKRYVKV